LRTNEPVCCLPIWLVVTRRTRQSWHRLTRHRLRPPRLCERRRPLPQHRNWKRTQPGRSILLQRKRKRTNSVLIENQPGHVITGPRQVGQGRTAVWKPYRPARGRGSREQSVLGSPDPAPGPARPPAMFVVSRRYNVDLAPDQRALHKAVQEKVLAGVAAASP
jgi:hypothetical protein